jgi:hypothetical protein
MGDEALEAGVREALGKGFIPVIALTRKLECLKGMNWTG